MATMTYYVALAFKRSEDGGDVVACDPKEARSSEQAIRMAASLARMEAHESPHFKNGLISALFGPST